MKSLNIIQNDELDIIYSVVKSVTKIDLAAKTKKDEWVHARSIFYKIAWVNEYSSMTMGSYVVRDHATVLHSLRKFDRVILKNEELNRLYHKCLQILSDISGVNKVNMIEEINKSSATYTNIQLAKEIYNLKIKAAENQRKLRMYISTDCPIEREIAAVLRKMGVESKKDLLLKATTILKVRTALQTNY